MSNSLANQQTKLLNTTYKDIKMAKKIYSYYIVYNAEGNTFSVIFNKHFVVSRNQNISTIDFY